MKGGEGKIQPGALQVVLILAVMAILPHIFHLPLLISLFFVLLVFWRFISLKTPRLAPGRLLLAQLTILGVVLVYTQHQTLMGRDAGVSLLTIMLILKLMELRNRRDIYVVCFMGYFIIVTQFLFSQAFILTVYCLSLIVCITALLLTINRITPSNKLLEPLYRTLAITLQAIPIAAILFILFPRFSQPLWQFGSGADTGITGLDDRVSPGSISHLIQSPSVAFRVKFMGEPPPAEDRYWRGLVLWDTDGLEWYNQTVVTPAIKSPKLTKPANPFRYEILLEPHYKKWLFSLELPVHIPERSRMTADYLLISDRSINQPRKYQMISYTRSITERPDQSLLMRALALPLNVTQRQIDLVESWKSRTGIHGEIVKLALQYFNSQPFVYSLMPPLYRENPVDQFLFDGREGFCEHYASSFTQLMRIAGIPTRMVIGYQGGEYNPLGEYFIIRQSDAHAWTEVWLESSGWTRIDPTAAVAPERVRHAIQLDFTDIGSPVLFQINGGGLLNSLFDQIGLVMDVANLSWRQWILGYNRKRQLNFLQNIGINFNKTWEWTSLLLSLIGFFLMLTTISIILKGRLREKPIVKSYNRLCHKLAMIGLPRRPSEGPLDYSRRIAKQRPDLSTTTQRLFGIYIRLRYANNTSRQTEKYFYGQVRRFRPKKSSS